MNFREADNAIFRAWVAGLFITLWSLFRSIMALSAADDETRWLAILSFTEVVIWGALTYGVYCKSRFCAVLMLILFVPIQIFRLINSINIWGIITIFMFGWAFIQGIQGTIVYQRVRQSQRERQIQS